MAADSAGFLSRLDAFLGALPPLDAAATPDARYAVELRDAALLTPRFIKLLRARGVRFCLSARERMPPAERQLPAQALMDEGAPGPLVLRWMLHAGFAYEQAESRYAPFDRLIDEDPHTRAVIAEQVVRTLRAGMRVFVDQPVKRRVAGFGLLVGKARMQHPPQHQGAWCTLIHQCLCGQLSFGRRHAFARGQAEAHAACASACPRANACRRPNDNCPHRH